MGQCNSCGKNKDIQSEFKSEKINKNGGFGLKKKFGMVQSFAMSLTSRGLTNKKINRANKQLRVLSCFGNQHVGGELPPCEHLENSETEGKYFCGGCGCGDKKGTWLMSYAALFTLLLTAFLLSVVLINEMEIKSRLVVESTKFKHAPFGILLRG